jgi:hypothetical protein
MTALYQLAVLGAPSKAQIHALEKCLKSALEPFNLRLGDEIGWEISPAEFRPHQLQPSAAVFFAGDHAHTSNLKELLVRGVPVVPVVYRSKQAPVELPPLLAGFDYVDYAVAGAQAVAVGLLQSVGLLAQQRKVFLSYCREELSEAATQLFEMLSARRFEVSLDHDDNTVDRKFSHQLWHRLCDSDVLLMLDTPTYFERRWTNAEFGRALAKGIGVLRVGWPDSTSSARASTASLLQLAGSEFNSSSKQFEESALQRICMKLEEVRSQSYAVRLVNFTSKLRIAVEASGGRLMGVGTQNMVYIQLSSGKYLKAELTLGVPANQQHNDRAWQQSDALIYDPIGLHSMWLSQAGLADDDAYPWIRLNEASLHFAYEKEGL